MADVKRTVDIVIAAKTANAQSSLNALAKGGLLVVAVAAAAAAKALIHLGVEGFRKLTEFTKEAIDASAEFERQLGQTEAVIKSTGGAAGFTANELVTMATSFSRNSAMSREAVLSAQNVILTFTKLGHDVMPQTTQTVLDMATALDKSLTPIAIQVGKALQDPILGVAALREVGVNFSASQTEVIKRLVETNNLAEAQALILKELATEFGGSAAKAAQTFAGRMTALENVWGELMATLGNFITQSPAVRSAVDVLIKVIEDLNRVVEENAPKISDALEGLFGVILHQAIPAARATALVAESMAFLASPTSLKGILQTHEALNLLFDAAELRAQQAIDGLEGFRKALAAQAAARDELPEQDAPTGDETDVTADAKALNVAEEDLRQHREARSKAATERREKAAFEAAALARMERAEAEETARAKVAAEAAAAMQKKRILAEAREEARQAELALLDFQLGNLQLTVDERLAILARETELKVASEEAAFLEDQERLAGQHEALEELEQAHQDRLTEIEGRGADERGRIDEGAKKRKTETALFFAQQSVNFARAAFGQSKSLARAQVVIDTAAAIMRGQAMFGPPPSPLGILATAIAIATGLAQLAAINSAKFHKGGVVPGAFGEERSVVVEGGEVIFPKEVARDILAPRTASPVVAPGTGLTGGESNTFNSLSMSLSANGLPVDVEEAPAEFRTIAGGFNDLVERSGMRVVATHVMVDGEPVPASRLLR